ncbi:MAG: aminotransferase class I/II-fold pyridoxal phosphate-dependent enzyme [Comamonadaceae bacterium]|nr:MAG: aminotransferase class I/II-fold pyridoxal phosphate-dependent enzyme [Comamonadaceae bacterium]
MKVDLRSDTVTRPTPGMREAMMAAPLGDDVYADDPSVNALQDKIAALLGFEGALFMPTGTQSNLCAILAHCQRGDEYIVGQMAHCYRWEGGGAAVFGSVQPQPLNHQSDGTMTLTEIEAAIKPDDAHHARTRLLALENTFGGKLLPMDYVRQAADLARNKGLARHLDGARLFNAAVAQAQLVGDNPVAAGPPQGDHGPLGGQRSTRSGERGGNILAEARRIAQCFDSVSVCFSKGLGAPAGSALCGSRELLARAHRIRKMAGGGMRQSGLLAAAASYALDHQVERMTQDHALARHLAAGLSGIAGLVVEPPQSNMVFVELVGPAKTRAVELLPFLAARGVLASGLYRLRFVTHLDVDAAGIDHALTVLRDFFAD